jgi:hypothetical protein
MKKTIMLAMAALFAASMAFADTAKSTADHKSCDKAAACCKKESCDMKDKQSCCKDQADCCKDGSNCAKANHASCAMHKK